MFQKYILDNKQNIINNLCDIITFPSVSIESDDSRFPFGKECSDCLKYFLNLASSLGFRTKNIDGYCGYAECGEGDELIGIIGHLDVVPADSNDGWTHLPFTPTISNGKIYGRGAIDDKGPVIASLYAMKSVMEYAKNNDIKLNKRIRLIVGLNEEKDWKCINYYKEHEEIPTISFSPDADFPCIYAEKAVVSLLLKEDIPSKTYITIDEIDCNNNALNVIPKICCLTFSIKQPLKINLVISFLKRTIEKYNYDIDIYKINENKIKLTSYGKTSHSAHPELGVNAISRLIIVFQSLLKECRIYIPIISEFCEYIGDDYYATNMQLNIEDESRKINNKSFSVLLKR